MDDGIMGPARQRDHSLPETDDAVLESGATLYSVAEAREIVRRVAVVSARMDADAFSEGFTEDCVVCFVQGPPLVGRQAVRDYIASRHGPSRGGNTCEKTLRTLNGNVFGVQWTNTWSDPVTGRRTRTRGTEFWIMRGDRIARWDGAVNAWEE